MSGPSRTAGMSPVRVQAAHELVLEQIRTAILLGRYRPGDSLPPERALAEFLNVSRTTVRGAISILAEEGLVEVKRGRGGGLFVRRISVSDSRMRTLLEANRDRIREVFEFRQTVEGASAALAAQRRTPGDLKEIRKLYDAMEAMKSPDGMLPTNPEDSAHFHSLDTEFHLAIARASHNPWFEQSVVLGRIEMFRPVGALFNSLDVTGDYLHDRILQAIEAGDPKQAGRSMTEHIRTTQQVLEGWIAQAAPTKGSDTVGSHAKRSG